MIFKIILILYQEKQYMRKTKLNIKKIKLKIDQQERSLINYEKHINNMHTVEEYLSDRLNKDKEKLVIKSGHKFNIQNEYKKIKEEKKQNQKDIIIQKVGLYHYESRKTLQEVKEF